MNIFCRRIVFLGLFCLLFLSSSLRANDTETAEMSPEQLYKLVYLIIEKTYLDKTFNGQDLDIWSMDRRYREQIKTLHDSELAIKTMLISLGDRYTRYLPKKEYQEKMEEINAKLHGIGIQIGLNKEKQVVVIAPIQGSPAFKAGLQSKDEILEVNDQPTKGLSIKDVADQIKGLPGTKVKLSIKRSDEQFSVEVERDEIHIDSIPEKHYTKLSSDICYIHLTSFIAQDATTELIDKMKSLQPCSSLILDLRNNPGGLLRNALEISSIFLEDEMDVVSTVDRDGYVQTQKVVSDISLRYPGDMVVLVNEGSASASEIFSGALQDNGRAMLVGSVTFGKGLVQLVKELPNGGGLNVTTAKYLTPNGTDINKVGIEPDHEVTLSKDEYKDKKGPWFNNHENLTSKETDYSKDKQLNKAISILEKRLNVE